MTNRVYEFSTWKTDDQSKRMEQIALTAAKNYNGQKFIVSIGEWGVRSFLVFAENKDEAKQIAIEYSGINDRVRVRDVTNSKKWNA